MKVTFIKTEDNKKIGYALTAETEQDHRDLEIIRDMHFWGLDDTVLKYDGRISSSKEIDDVRTLSWIQKAYSTSGLNIEQSKPFRWIYDFVSKL